MHVEDELVRRRLEGQLVRKSLASFTVSFLHMASFALLGFCRGSERKYFSQRHGLGEYFFSFLKRLKNKISELPDTCLFSVLFISVMSSSFITSHN